MQVKKENTKGPRTKSLYRLTPCKQAISNEFPRSVPGRDFVIWFSARTGSTWLASLLFSAGFPKPDEYFHPNKIIRRATYLGVNNWSDYVLSIKKKRTRSGLFCHEMTFQFWDMLRNDGNAMSYLDFSGPSVVLFREDIVLQAVSIYLAVSNKKWHRYEGTDRLTYLRFTEYDEAKIRGYVDYILKQESGLEEHRDDLISSAKFLSYEQLLSNSATTVVRAFERHIGFRAANISNVRSFHAKVGSGINWEMRDRFLAMNKQLMTEIRDKRSWLFDSKNLHPLLDING